MDFLLIKIIIALAVYILVEFVFRESIVFCISRKKCTSFPLITSGKWNAFILLSPGLWISENCKISIRNQFPSKSTYRIKLAIFIKNSNHLNFIVSLVLYVVLLFTTINFPRIDNEPLEILAFVIMWRYISRSVEIAFAFGRDILSPDSSSNLDNHERMWIAIKSYFEIFIYSAAFYSAFSCKVDTIFEPILTSLFVGTLTNISGALELLIHCCEYDLSYKSLLLLSVYLQVFATLSLIFFGFAGYLGRVKSNIKKSTHSPLMRAYRKSRAR